MLYHGEDALLHFTTVVGATNNGDVLLDVEGDEDVGVEALLLPVGVRHLARVDDGEVGLEVLDFLFSLCADEHVAHKVVLQKDDTTTPQSAKPSSTTS